MTEPRAAPSVRPTEYHPSHVRSVVDIVRFGVGVVMIVAGIVFANTFDSTLLGLAEDTNATVDRLPDWLRDVAAASLASVVIAAAAAATIYSLLTTRYRRFGLFALGFALAAGLSILVGEMIYNLVDEDVRASFNIDVPIFRISNGDARLSPSDPLLAGAVASMTIGSSFLSRRLTERAGWLVALYLVGSVITIGVPPLAVLADVGAGLCIGSLLLMIFGRHDLSLRTTDVSASLASSGIEITELAATQDSRSRWVANQVSGRQLFVAGFDRDDRSNDLLIRLIRWIRLRKTGDHRPFVSLRRLVEHEALVSQQATNSGVHAPTIRAVASAGVDGMVFARDRVSGASATSQPELSDAVMRSIWAEVKRLHTARIAHGALHLGNVIIDDDGQPWLVNFERGELAAPDQRLGTDLAEMLGSMAAAVGTERTARLAHEVLGAAILETAVPWLQPLALTSETRQTVQEAGGLEELRGAVAEISGTESQEPVRLERVEVKTLFVLATLVLSAWFLVPQLADLDSIWSQVRDGSLSWALLAVCFSVLTYVAATGALLGAIPTRLRFPPALLAQIASSFANRVTPAKVGGVATNIRYFQRQGVPTAVSVTAVGLNAIAGLMMHITLTLCFLLVASGGDSANGIGLPSTGAIVLGLAATLAVIAGAFAVKSTRRLLVTHVVPQVKSGWESMQTIMHEPSRLVALFGGSAAITLLYMGAMTASLEAFGSTASFPAVGLLFLTGSAVANAAPTPGGLGAAEAALIAAFSTVEDSQVVVPAVFLYRLVTFWLPILPGWVALTYLRQTDRI